MLTVPLRPSHPLPAYGFFFFFNDPATTEIYTLSLHDALPISAGAPGNACGDSNTPQRRMQNMSPVNNCTHRSEEHTSELQSPYDLVCRLLLEKKKTSRTAKNTESTAESHKARATVLHIDVGDV